MSMVDMHKDSDREVGQFSLPIYGASQLKGKSAKEVADLKLKEIKNGRLAMLGMYSEASRLLSFLLSVRRYSNQLKRSIIVHLPLSQPSAALSTTPSSKELRPSAPSLTPPSGSSETPSIKCAMVIII
jgi:hypothetical protein